MSHSPEHFSFNRELEGQGIKKDPEGLEEGLPKTPNEEKPSSRQESGRGQEDKTRVLGTAEGRKNKGSLLGDQNEEVSNSGLKPLDSKIVKQMQEAEDAAWPELVEKIEKIGDWANRSEGRGDIFIA